MFLSVPGTSDALSELRRLIDLKESSKTSTTITFGYPFNNTIFPKEIVFMARLPENGSKI